MFSCNNKKEFRECCDLPLTFVFWDALTGQIFAAGAGAQVKCLPKLQVKKPHLQESVHVACGSKVC